MDARTSENGALGRVGFGLPERWTYETPLAEIDEALATSGEVRPPFAAFFAALRNVSPEELSRRFDRARRIIRENGVTYNVYGDPRGMDRPWQLDPLPLVVDGAEWAALERGLVQRARLLDAVLADLYGPRRTLASGLLPAELVLSHPGYLRPLCGFRPAEGVHLHSYGVDIARGTDRRFYVVDDRTQAPSGAGYALENRIVIARMLAQPFRDCRVERLAPFFQALRDGLAGLSPRRDNPRVVLLTPGPYNETYCEHAYLARYLGYTLVEGGDLTVRDRVVYLKTLGGLERIDVILRRLDDGYCDPLCLRPDSLLGVPGLVHAVRAGSVVVANALGSGVLETPALPAFLPRLCRELLGEELKLPSIRTFYCGEPESLAYVIEHLSDLVIHSAWPGPASGEAVFGGELGQSERAELVAKIRHRPGAWVARERPALSTVPVYDGHSLKPRHFGLRAFLARRGDEYVVMPGGLTRFASSRDSLVVSMQRGGGSKDTWVLSSGEPSSVTLLHPPGLPIAIVRSGADLPSRVADNLFWIGRHVERADGTCRLIRSLLLRAAEEEGERSPEIGALVRALGADFEQASGIPSRPGAPLDVGLASVLFSDERHSPKHEIALGYRAASRVRDRISMDTWRVLSHLHLEVERAARRKAFDTSDALELSFSLLLGFSAFSGLVMENMTHGPGWRFADMGRRIERAAFMVRLIRSTLLEVASSGSLDAVLDVADSTITYRSRYFGTLAPEPVLDLLITDETNPRSIAYQLVALKEHVGQLPRARSTPLLSAESKTIVEALSVVRLADLERIARADAHGHRGELAALLGHLERALPTFAEQITLSYLAHVQPSVLVEGVA
ncbi:MAG: circularly permuted type 2 ATP-grasp protein [Pseudomonadota bacterium]|nr:MAG: hypothetical protein DIU78_07515 [Pseudomonadota bacterium]